jgi:hypothetical protein
MSQPFVPTEVVQKLLEGSYENKARQLESLAESAAVFGEYKGRIKVIGMFNGHAIVVTENARFAKLMFEESHSGELMIVGVKPVDVPVYENSNELRKFYKSEAATITESFLGGQVDVSRIKDLMLALNGDTAKTDDQIVDNMIEASNADRTWKHLFEAKKTARLVEAVLEGTEIPTFKPKFTKLYDGSMPLAEAEGYRALVKSDLTKLVGELDSVVGDMEQAFASLPDLIEDQNTVGKNDAVVDLRAFIKDLLEDLMGAQQAAAEALEQVTTISALGKLHDALAEGLAAQKVASQFISRVVATNGDNQAK